MTAKPTLQLSVPDLAERIAECLRHQEITGRYRHRVGRILSLMIRGLGEASRRDMNRYFEPVGLDELFNRALFVAHKLEAKGGSSLADPTVIEAVPIERSVWPDRLVCLEDGQECVYLKTPLKSFEMTPLDYKRKWGLENYVVRSLSSDELETGRPLEVYRRSPRDVERGHIPEGFEIYPLLPPLLRKRFQKHYQERISAAG